MKRQKGPSRSRCILFGLPLGREEVRAEGMLTVQSLDAMLLLGGEGEGGVEEVEGWPLQA